MIIPPPTLPTDLEILSALYKLYYKDFVAFDEKNPTRDDKYIVPIDCEEVARELNADAELVFSRLYYRLNQEYGYSKVMPDGKKLLVKVFIREPGWRKHYVHFPFMTSVLADLREKEEKFWIGIVIAAFALITAIASLLKDGVNF